MDLLSEPEGQRGRISACVKKNTGTGRRKGKNKSTAEPLRKRKTLISSGRKQLRGKVDPANDLGGDKDQVGIYRGGTTGHRPKNEDRWEINGLWKLLIFTAHAKKEEVGNYLFEEKLKVVGKG